MLTKLKSTGQQVHLLESMKQGLPDWPADYRRVLIPNPHGKNHIQIVHKRNLTMTKTAIGE